jgi:DeoR family transcriptional regulator of aga operon
MAGIAEHDRQQRVLAMLEEAGRVGVPELVERFGVSAVTVRKDLELLERRHLLRRVRGGAVVAEGADEGAFELRLRHSVAAKQAIAQRAADEPGRPAGERLAHRGDRGVHQAGSPSRW